VEVEGAGELGHGLGVAEVGRAGSRNHYQVHRRTGPETLPPEPIAYSPLDAVAHDGASDTATDRDAESRSPLWPWTPEKDEVGRAATSPDVL
jgi:hypothetical protein